MDRDKMLVCGVEMFVEEGQMQERMMEDNNGIGGEVAR
jgi:hypothetical protein